MATHLDLEEQEQIDQLKHFWSRWGTPITGVLVVAFGGFAAWNGWQYWQQRQAVQASALADAVQVAIEAKDEARVAQSLKDIQDKYASTQQAGLAALAAAKAQVDAGKLDDAKATLTWVSEKAADEGHKAVARVRLAAVLMEQKDLDGAGKVLAGSFPAEFAGVQADRQGDLLQLQGKPEEAAQAYERAYKALDTQNEYRRLVEFKLNALGVQPQTMAAAGGTETAK